MYATAKIAQDHLVTLSALEVLRLIADRLERDEIADPEDVNAILQFFKDVARPCFDRNVEGLLVELETCFRSGECAGFVDASRRYTDTLMKVLVTDVNVRVTLRGA